jgi:hypothetical protein
MLAYRRAGADWTKYDKPPIGSHRCYAVFGVGFRRCEPKVAERLRGEENSRRAEFFEFSQACADSPSSF